MIKALSVIGLLAGNTAAFATEDKVAATEHASSELLAELMAADPKTGDRGRELFPLYSIGTKCARFCDARADSRMALTGPAGKSGAVKGPVKALEMLALNDDLATVVRSESFCTRRNAMARAVGLAAGLAMSVVNAPAFAAETKKVKMGSDSGQLVFVPDEIKICKGDTVSWVNNKGGPHNVVFEEEGLPKGVDKDDISMDDQLGDEGDTYDKKFDTPGTYNYYCEPHAGGGMKATLIVE
jgi:plastocyanin